MTLGATVDKELAPSSFAFSVGTRLDPDQYLTCALETGAHDDAVNTTKLRASLDRKLSALVSLKTAFVVSPQQLELNTKCKYTPSDLLSLFCGGALALSGGPSLNAGCELRNVPDDLSRVSWTMNLAPKSVALRFSLHRAGLNFDVPVEVRSSEVLHAEALYLFSLAFVTAPLLLKLKYAPRKWVKLRRKAAAAGERAGLSVALEAISRRVLSTALAWGRRGGDDGTGAGAVLKGDGADEPRSDEDRPPGGGTEARGAAPSGETEPAPSAERERSESAKT